MTTNCWREPTRWLNIMSIAGSANAPPVPSPSRAVAFPLGFSVSLSLRRAVSLSNKRHSQDTYMRFSSKH